MQQFDAQSLRLIGSLKFEPGYVLLLDMLQAELDTLSDDLAQPALSSDEAHNKLRYWQAFRSILGTLKVTPENYLQTDVKPQVAEEALDSSAWFRKQAAMYPSMYDDSLN